MIWLQLHRAFFQKLALICLFFLGVTVILYRHIFIQQKSLNYLQKLQKREQWLQMQNSHLNADQELLLDYTQQLQEIQTVLPMPWPWKLNDTIEAMLPEGMLALPEHWLNSLTPLEPVYIKAKPKVRPKFVFGIDLNVNQLHYFSGKIKNLLPHNKKSKKSVVIVICLSGLNETQIKENSNNFEDIFQSYLQMENVFIIVPPKQYYPRGILRHYVRLNLNYLFTMMFVQQTLRPRYFMQLSAYMDIEMRFMAGIERALRLLNKRYWLLADFYHAMYFPGKLLRAQQMSHLIALLQLFYDKKPAIYLLLDYARAIYCDAETFTYDCRRTILEYWWLSSANTNKRFQLIDANYLSY